MRRIFAASLLLLLSAVLITDGFIGCEEKSKPLASNNPNDTAADTTSQPPRDTLPPVGISDLRIMRTSQASIDIAWTAPGDDWYDGRASKYYICRDTMRIDTNRLSQLSLPNAPSVLLPGLTQSMTIQIPDSSKPFYYIGIVTEDDAGNRSGLSNQVIHRAHVRNLIWAKRYGSSASESLVEGFVKADGNVLLFGVTSEADTQGDIWLTSIDTSGSVLSSRILSQAGGVGLKSVHRRLSNSYILAVTHGNGYVMEVDETGNELRTIALPPDFYLVDAASQPSGNVVILVSTTRFSSCGRSGLFIYSIDGTGTEVWSRFVAGLTCEQPWGIRSLSGISITSGEDGRIALAANMEYLEYFSGPPLITVLAQTLTPDGAFGGYITGAGGYETYASKVVWLNNQACVLQWTYNYGPQAANFAASSLSDFLASRRNTALYDAISTPIGNVCLVGISPYLIDYPYNETRDVFICGASAAGDLIWHASFDAGGDESVNSVIKLNDNNFLIVGNSAISGNANRDAFIAKFHAYNF